MNSERRILFELIAIAAGTLVLAYVVPPMLRARESTALLGGLLLIVSWAGWLVLFIHRLARR